MTAPLCSLCAQQHRGPRPMHHTASGVWVCPTNGETTVTVRNYEIED